MSVLEFRDTCGDNFDTSHIGYFWDNSRNIANIAIVSNTSGMSGNCFKFIPGPADDVWLLKNLSAASSKAFHLRCTVSALPTTGYGTFVAFENNGNIQSTIRVASTGSISIWQGGTNAKLCESAPAVVSSGVAFVISVGIAFSNAGLGSATVQVNGAQICSASNVTTTIDGTSTCSQFVLVLPNTVNASPYGSWAGSPAIYYDDVIVDTGTAAVRSPQRNYWLPASGVGRYSQMSAVGAANGWQCVTDTSPEPDDDTTYVAAGSAGLKNAYTITNPNVSNVDFGLHRIIVAKTDDGGAATLTPGFSNGTTDASGTAIAVPSSYQALRQSFDNNPITGTGPTAADLATLQLLDTRSA